MIDIREYQDVGGRSPYREWFQGLDSEAARKVTKAIYRIGLGNLSNTKSVGGGVLEFRINFGPGYRLYFGREGQRIIILLGGGTKQRQQQEIARALQRWSDYKRRKQQRNQGE